MKQVFANVVVRFLADYGDQYRFLYRRWWHHEGGVWVRGGREQLEKDLVNLMWGSFYDHADKWTRADMNQMCSYLSLRLEGRGLPAKQVPVDADPNLIHPALEPVVTERL